VLREIRAAQLAMGQADGPGGGKAKGRHKPGKDGEQG
jgi:hypothetical protein